MQWFDVDKEGLAQLIAGRGVAGAVVELVQNAFDTDADEVEFLLYSEDDEHARLVVKDNHPEGFTNLAHAFTLFAPSEKKSDATKRGRFNLGEKLVLALCDKASISSTKGTVIFEAEGRRETAEATTSGSVVDLHIRLTREQVADALELVGRVFVPKGVRFFVNSTEQEYRAPDRVWNETLPTEIAGPDGTLRRTARKTTVSLVRPRKGEKPHLYEIGIPVVEVDGPFHIDIGQKVPLNLERTNVNPAYLRALQVTVVNHAPDLITEEQAGKGWVAEALSDERVTVDAVRTIVEAKYGVPVEQLVRFDPSDPQSSREAQSRGLTVVGGRAFTPEQWANINKANLLPAAGQVAPSRNAVLNSGDLDTTTGEVLKVIPVDDWTPAQRAVAQYATSFATALLGNTVRLELVKDGRAYIASYLSHRIRFNLTHLWKKFWTDQRAIDELLIHECAHEFASDHLDHRYYEAVCRLAAKAREITVSLSDYTSETVTFEGTAKRAKVLID